MMGGTQSEKLPSPLLLTHALHTPTGSWLSPEPCIPLLCLCIMEERSVGKPAHRLAEHPLEARKLERDSWDEV